MNSAPVSEIYASVQGEGPYTGERQIFVRLAGCPLRCRYCDTPESLVAKGHPRFTVDQVVAKILKLRGRTNIQTVSITGGEPLVYVRFLEELLPKLKKKKLKIYLETAGVHPQSLEQVVSNVDVISMDMKLPSATGRFFWKEHKKFLKVGGKKIFVKVVLERMSKMSEVKKVVSILIALKKSPTLVLQPVTPLSSPKEAPTTDQIAQAYGWAASKLAHVLVMPQQHKIWSVR